MKKIEECKPIKILMEKDNITYGEAKQLVTECRDALLKTNSNPNSDILADEIIMDYLGLEPDYLYDILDV